MLFKYRNNFNDKYRIVKKNANNLYKKHLVSVQQPGPQFNLVPDDEKIWEDQSLKYGGDKKSWRINLCFVKQKKGEVNIVGQSNKFSNYFSMEMPGKKASHSKWNETISNVNLEFGKLFAVAMSLDVWCSLYLNYIGGLWWGNYA